MRTPSACRPRRCCKQQFRLGGQDDVGRLLPHLVLDQRHGHARRVAAERLKALQQRPLEGAEKAGDSLHVEDVDELVDGAVRGAGTEGLVGNLGQRRFVLRMPQHAVQLGLLPPFGRRLQLGRALLQPGGDEHCLLNGLTYTGLGIGVKLGENGFQGVGCWHE